MAFVRRMLTCPINMIYHFQGRSESEFFFFLLLPPREPLSVFLQDNSKTSELVFDFLWQK